jgi:ribosome-binding factor A
MLIMFSRKRVFSIDQPISKSFYELNSSTQRGPSGTPQKSNKSLRRMEVFNVLFMEQITSLMSTGEASPEVVGLGLTISRVRIAPDFSGVNVYWVASGTTQESLIEPILLKAAGRLRHELSQLRVMGIVPPIEFVKDRKYSKATEVEYLLSKCDFGEDFVPTPSHKFFAQTDSPKEARVEEISAEEESELDLDPPQKFVPSTEMELYKSVSMRQDILGVKHDLIMSQVWE